MAKRTKKYMLITVFSAMVLGTAVFAFKTNEPEACKVGIVMHDKKYTQNKIAQFMLNKLPKSGFSMIPFSYEDLCDNTKLNNEQIQMLIIPESTLFPVDAAESLRQFLKKGGSLITLGGDPFSRPLLSFKGNWYEFSEVAAELYADPQSVCLMDPEMIKPEEWKSYKKNNDTKSNVSVVTDNGKKVFLLQHRTVNLYDEFSVQLTPSSPTDADSLLFYAKADDYTPQTVVRITDKNGKKYEYIIELRPEWNAICIPLQEMKSVAANNTNRVQNVQDIEKITFAMTEVRHNFGDHDVYISAVYGVKKPEGLLKQIETEEFFLSEDRDVYRYDDAITTVSYKSAPIAGFTAKGEFSGISAVGFPYYGESNFLPLLEAQDQFGRRRGWAAGMVVNYNGPWKGSQWAVFGVKEDSWYQNDKFIKYIGELIKFMTDKEKLKTINEKVAISAPASEPTSAPLPRITIKNNTFVKPDGTPFFIVGENWGGFLYDRPTGKYDYESLNQLFSHLSGAGVNALRILNANQIVNNNDIELLCDAAERWGVYLLIGATPYPKEKYSTKKDIQAYAKKLAASFKDKSVLLGYDLCNEPYVHEVGAYRDDNGVFLRDKYPYSKVDLQKFIDTLTKVKGYGANEFYGHTSLLQKPSDPKLGQAFTSVNNIYGEWISWFREAFNEAGDTHPISVGYNMWYEALPCNTSIDFITHHAYVYPGGLKYVEEEITVMDRLQSMFPDKPITLGEFGYTHGYILKGRPLSAQCQAVGEMMHVLYSWANGYNGVFDWQVYDKDPVNYTRIATWSENKNDFKKEYERFHGMYTWDGSPEGMLKPYGMATKFFSEAVAAGMDRGNFKMYESDTQIGTGYVFTAKNALMVGDLKYSSDILSFNSDEERTVGMYWDSEKLVLMSTGDVTVTINPYKLNGITIKSNTDINGKTGSIKWKDDALELHLLAGERVVVPGAVTKK